MNYEPGYREVSSYKHENIIAGNFPLLTETVTIAAGQSLKKGAVLGKNGDGEYVLSTSAVEDGSQNPVRILATDCTTTDKSKDSIAYRTGRFRATKLQYGEGHSFESVKDSLELRSIFLES